MLPGLRGRRVDFHGVCNVEGGQLPVGRDSDPAKVRAAHAAANLVESGMVVGLGTGSTATLMLKRLGERVELEA